MKLFLSGGGNGDDSYLVDKRFIESIDVSKPILYIPIAINTFKHPYPQCLEWLRDTFSKFNFDNFVMWTEEDLKGKQEKDFEQFGAVYIGGGNTFKLLNNLKTFGTFEIIKNLAKKGTPVYGGSAGAILLTNTILPASYLDTNEINLTDFSALNLTHGFDIWCHYKSEMKVDLITFMKENGLKKMITIPENAGLFVTENKIESVGQGKTILFQKCISNEHLFSDGELIYKIM